jgi:predicted AAA+ superfamily ATPase
VFFLALNPAAGPVIVDEVQKIPELLDEVQWTMENLGVRFILSGFSARKLRRAGPNLLGGRAVRRELFPLVSAEIPQFELERALSRGLLPRIYQSEYEWGNRQLQEHGAGCRGQRRRLKDYYAILVDTLLGEFVPAFRLRPKRRVIQAPKFYLFDVGVCGALVGREHVLPRSESFGRAFEHLLWQELRASSQYSGRRFTISYWRTSSHFEVDSVLGKGEVALEIKASEELSARHLKGCVRLARNTLRHIAL